MSATRDRAPSFLLLFHLVLAPVQCPFPPIFFSPFPSFCPLFSLPSASVVIVPSPLSALRCRLQVSAVDTGKRGLVDHFPKHKLQQVYWKSPPSCFCAVELTFDFWDASPKSMWDQTTSQRMLIELWLGHWYVLNINGALPPPCTGPADPLSNVIKHDTSMRKQRLGHVICDIFLPSLPPSLFLPHPATFSLFIPPPEITRGDFKPSALKMLSERSFPCMSACPGRVHVCDSVCVCVCVCVCVRWIKVSLLVAGVCLCQAGFSGGSGEQWLSVGAHTWVREGRWEGPIAGRLHKSRLH